MHRTVKDWKTTIPAAISAVAFFVLFAPEHFSRWPVVIDFAKYVAAGGLLFFGVNATSYGEVPCRKKK